MNPDTPKLAAGLWFVATPIGSARDITLRALDVLAAADVLVAEDTRSLRKLMEIHGVSLRGRRIVAYHDHSGEAVRERLVAAVRDGQSVAYASEAGMPLVADPGFRLGRAVTAAGGMVTVVPGASAPLAALVLSGLPSDAFFFAGFLPAASAARRARLGELAAVPGTLIFFESPGRVAAMLADAAAVLGPGREAALAREITKKFEEVLRAPLGDLAARLAESPVKGEIVVLIGRADSADINESDVEEDLRQALADMSLRDATDLVARAHGLARRDVYQRALGLTKKE